MKTPTLIDVPKTGPSAHDRLKAFKEKHGILTHRTAGLDHPWIALIPREKDKGKGIGQIVGESVVFYMETAQLGTGTGELTAIRTLCAQLGMECDL